jgi:hypothetical protein
MNKMLSLPGMSRKIRRAEVLGYVESLSGIFLIVWFGLMEIPGSVTLETIGRVGGIVLGLSVIGSGILVYLNPDSIRKGSDPAPGYVLIFAVIATVVFVGFILLNIAIETSMW